jgi:glucuronokinase
VGASGNEPGGDVDAVVVVPARAGLVGNPSDGFGGAVLATPLPGIAATVTARSTIGVSFASNESVLSWPSVGSWCEAVDREGHGDEQRIISAALWTLVDHLRRRSIPHDGVELTWTTDVPRSVGLAGSSALAVGVIDACARAWAIELDPRVVAALALRAEREVLGIAAGWQDRIVQAHRCTVLVDASVTEVVDGCEVPAVWRLRAPEGASASLVVGWSGAAGESSDQYHAPLRRSADALVTPMAELAVLARVAADAWQRGAFDVVARAMGDGWRVRQGCAPLRPDHTAVVEVVRAAGVAATTPGSGGSVVALCLDDAEVGRGRAALEAAGLSLLVQRVG